MAVTLERMVEQPEQPRPWTPEAFAPDRLAHLSVDLIPPEDERQGRRFGVHIIDGMDEHADLGRYVEWTVFDKVFKNDLETMRREYEPYDQVSTFLVVMDYENNRPAGVLRIIRPNHEVGLKSLNDLAYQDSPWHREGDTPTIRLGEMGADFEHTADIATMAVAPAYRSAHSRMGVSASLYSSCVRWSQATGHNYWVSIVDENIYTMMQSWGEPWETFDGAGFEGYLDSEASLPVHLELNSGLEKVYAADPNIHALYTQGAGLEDQFVLPQL